MRQHVHRLSVSELIGPINELEAANAPAELFVVGRHDWLRTVPRVAVVGSRRATEAGRDEATAIVRHLVERDALVVSGLAEGIDQVVHSTAIETRGRTAAVLGTPLSSCFPRCNLGLQHRMMEEHVVLSQFTPERPVGRGAFPLRNRTMALLTHATIVVEAGERSGTRHQVWEAIRLGRPVLLARALLDAELTWATEAQQYGAVVFETLDELSAALDALVPGEPVEDLLEHA